MNCVDWYQARTFSRWIGGDLPSEAQWEYAARNSGQQITYPWGDDEATCDHAVMRGSEGAGCTRSMTWPVCSKARGNSPNEACDLAGNLWEWTLDQYRGSYRGAPTDGSAVCETPACDRIGPGRVLRGGSWLGDAETLRAAYRFSYGPSGRRDNLGFRPVTESP